MLEHPLWSPGHLTVRTIRTRGRRGAADEHVVEVLRDCVLVADGDDEGVLRATSGLVLAEAPITRTTEANDGAPGLQVPVEVFGEHQGSVLVRHAESSAWRRRLDAELLVAGDAAARLRTVGPRAEDAVVVAGDTEVARLARFDHLRGWRRTISSWDLDVVGAPDPRLWAVTIAALLRMSAVHAAATARRPA